jgi:hypothetical protein
MENKSNSSHFDKIKEKLFSLNNRLFKDKRLANTNELIETMSLAKYDPKNIVDCLINLKFYENVIVTQDTSCTPGKHLLRDVEFFESNSVFSHLHSCSLMGSHKLAEEVYRNLVYNATILKQRVKVLEAVEEQFITKQTECNHLLDTMHKNERYMVWLLEEKEENLKELYDIVFFRSKMTKCLNRSSSCLTAYNMYRMFFSPLFGIVSPILYFVVPWIIIVLKFKLRISFTAYMRIVFNSILSTDTTLFGKGKMFMYMRIASYLFSAVFYLQGIFSSVDLAKTVHKISKLLIGNLNGIIEYVKSYQELVKYIRLSDSKNIKPYFELPLPLNDDNKQKSMLFLQELVDVHGPFSVLRNFGRQLNVFKRIDTHGLTVLQGVLQHSYMVDVLIGAVKYKTFNQFNYATIVGDEHVSEQPILKIEDMVHPCIDKTKAITNSVHLGDGSKEQNLILTSPNSSGKSLLIKSIIVNVIMAQTMGIICAKNLVLTPFAFINTQINVPDETGRESLFEAEMHRCKDNLDILEQMKKKYSLIVMDEIFNSTNPLEAVAGAYAVCKKMASYTNNILIFTTHYNYLTKLAKDKTYRFANYKMETIVNFDNIQFTYKLQRGVNKHLLALELLKRNGFDNDVIEEAIAIKNMLQKQ